MSRKIIHVDMDAFYASIEQRDQSELRGRPVIVGGSPNSRSVVATASYEARKYGIHSAMSCAQAYRRCPHAVFVRPHFAAYQEVSNHLHEIFHQYTDLVEPLALDEAYLDVTTNKYQEASATHLAKRILQQIHQETGLTASAGVSFNKFLAKLASGWQKPAGLTVITPDQAASLIEKLPVGRFYGVGKATEKKMLGLGLRSGKDLQEFGLENLCRYFGKSGTFFYYLAQGQDHRAVNPSRVRKSLGKETTFEKNIVELPLLKEELSTLCARVSQDLLDRHLQGRTISIKVRYDSFKTITRSCTLRAAINSCKALAETAYTLLSTTEAGSTPVRLLGISVSSFEDPEEGMWSLF